MAESIGPRREFLGWDRPALVSAADRLTERFGRDFSEVTLVVPTRRAGRRLETLLLLREPVLARPRTVTPGGLADLLVQTAGPARVGGKVADELTAGLAWVSVLRDVAPEALARVLPEVPDEPDFGGWWALARRVQQLREQLAAGRKTLEDAVEGAGAQDPRWAVLASLEGAYHATLAERRQVDLHAAREAALRGGTRLDGSVILTAVADLTPLHRAVVRCAGDAVSMVFAPAEKSEAFADDGCLVDTAWEHQGLPISEDTLGVVERRGDQPCAVVTALQDLAAGRRETEVSVGVGEEGLGPAVVRAIEGAGGGARSAVGQTLLETGPCTLLAALARYAESRRFDALAALLRHPDVELFLESELAGEDGRGREDWLTLLDRFLSESLRRQTTPDWLNDERVPSAMREVFAAVESLLPPPDERRPLPAWSGPWLAVLERAYVVRSFDETIAGEAASWRALQRVASCLDEQALLAASRDDVPTVTAAQAIRLTLSRLAGEAVPDPSTRGGVEVMGLLDLALDDAPVSVVTSLNEGHVPAAIGRDAGGLLPGSLRVKLGLPEARRRLARDTYLLNAVVASRESVKLLAARRDDEGNPLQPSRVLLLSDDAVYTARRLKWFFEDGPSGVAGDTATEAASAFGIPRPKPTDFGQAPDKPSVSLPVTAFRDYLACPYRFYLKHILRLLRPSDDAVEMDALVFGTLVHAALADFATSADAPRDSTDANRVAGFFSDALLSQARRRFGESPRAAVRVQLAFAEERLRVFAPLQAHWTRQGWEVRQAEHQLKTFVRRARGTALITGQLDRVDHHPELGWRIIDFKTGDTHKTPKDTHFKRADGVQTWADLQLPLYRDLFQGSAQFADVSADVSLGHVVLPRKPSEVGWHALDLPDSEWEQALAERDRVIDGVLSQDFRPSFDLPTWDDGLTEVCADGWPGRAANIRLGGFGGD